MQKFILFISFALIVFTPDFCYSQGTSGRFDKNEISKIKKSFNWDIQDTYRGRLMFLDVPYRSGDSLQYVTLTVAKDYNNNRPVFISVIVPPLPDPNNGISLIFAKSFSDSGKWKTAIDKSTYITLPIERCNKQFCTARMYKGISKETNSNDTTDVFKEFMSFNHLVVSFTDEGGREKVMIPLFSFQKKYTQLLAMDEKPAIKIPYDSIQLASEEKVDDSVWPDGTIPSTWATAGFHKPLQFKRFLKYLKLLVKNNEKKEIAGFIDYSLLETKRTTKNIKDENDFLKNYNKLFNDRVKTALENQNLSEIFRNSSGAMIGNGQLWFEETDRGAFKITSINF